MDRGEGRRLTRCRSRSRFDEARLQRFGQQAGSNPLRFHCSIIFCTLKRSKFFSLRTTKLLNSLNLQLSSTLIRSQRGTPFTSSIDICCILTDSHHPLSVWSIRCGLLFPFLLFSYPKASFFVTFIPANPFPLILSSSSSIESFCCPHLIPFSFLCSSCDGSHEVHREPSSFVAKPSTPSA